MAVKVMPAAHPVGSTIEVVDLFFNTPARRRFLKSDKTEFTHIDEWLKRIALVRGDIHFTLTHNGKTVRNYRPAMNEAQYLQRLTQVCGRPFAEQALKIECQHDDLRLSGYLQSPWSPVISDTHYFYVNGRLIRDRLVNHAVRQAFAQKAEIEQPGYVLMLDIDPHQVDVNVHPAKHEVRFHQSRYVHDYILQALQSALEEAGELNFVHSSSLGEVEDVFVDAPTSAAEISAPFALGADSALVNAQTDTLESAQDSVAPAVQVKSVGAGREGASFVTQTNAFGSMTMPRDSSRGSYSAGESRQRTELPSKAAIASYGALLQTPSYSVKDQDYQSVLPMPSILDGQYWVMTSEDKLCLLSIKSVALATRCQEIEAKLATGLIGQPLLMPVSVAADADWQAVLTEHDTLIRQLGLELTIRYQQLIIKKVPPYIRESQLAKVIPEWLQSLRFETPAPSALAFWLAKHSLTGFVSAPEIWAAFSQLAEEKKQLIANKAIFLPWQSWLEE
jgi:DNA mismatch repair protein MutL